MATIIEALENANYNLNNLAMMPMLFPLIKSQLNNATTLLNKGYNIYTEIEPLLDKYGLVENVPEIDDNDDVNQDD